MLKCPECSEEVSAESPSCPSCGAALDASGLPTLVRPDEPKRAPSSGNGAGEARQGAGSGRGAIHTSATTDSIDEARFAPGHVLAGRYRIVGLLGRGGMGEVYRADDLVLKQPVALKFLPEAVSGDATALERFRREVRVARQISHPNVCRVYDIVEADGLNFLSMEFIRGEELASVLKRFGRLPADKATEIARQICAGVAAAHKGGVLHRDLKPANVMIDEAGEARVTDFGLAALAEEVRGGEIIGTPAYMSPEQLAGKELTVRSDIYSLGLVLYELYTGKRAFDARTLRDLLQLRKGDTQPSSPSSLVKDFDPLVERVILRCLEAEPNNRPASALEVAAALPGGDPLAAALAMGETPSPEMVAAAPKQGILRPPVALACLAATVVLLALAVLLFGRAGMMNVMPLEKSTEVLADHAREITRRLGYTQRPVDTAEGFFWYGNILDYVKEHDSSPHRWDSVRSGEAPVLLFWHRQSPRYIVPFDRYSVASNDPPMLVSGETYTALDTLGRLQVFVAMPPQFVEPQPSSPQPQPDWSPLFAEAGFDMSKFAASEPRWTPPRQSDTRAAWDGMYPGGLQIPIHVEAASFRGRVVYFDITYPWDKPLLQEENQPSLKQKAENYLFTSLFVVVVLSATLLAWRNVRAGRSDRKGAFNLALYIFAAALASGLLAAHHVAEVRFELDILQTQVVWALGAAVVIWIIYLALEPFVRARWPHQIISWKRLLSGDLRDPLVGRDALVGVMVGAALAFNYAVWRLAPGLLGLTPSGPWRPAPDTLLGLRAQLSYLLHACVNGPVVPLAGLLLLLLFRVVLRRDWLAVFVGWVVGTLFVSLQFDSLALDLFFVGANAALYLFALMRFGLLTAAFSHFAALLLLDLAVTPDLSAWYAGATLIVAATLVGIAAYGFYTSLGGQPIFRGDLLDRT
jgi:serine/threonine-protein kinase